ncbi:MAG: alpha/beta hydrolase [Promethearchaeota archaeon]
MKSKTFQIPRSIGGNLNAVLYLTEKGPKTTPFVILCHGFGGDQHEWGRFPEMCQALNEAGYDAVTFDFSGSGKNPREPITLQHQVRDLEDVYAWAKTQNYAQISTIGLSFGGLTSLVVNLPERKAAVFWAPAFYLRRLIPKFQKFMAHIAYILHFPPLKRESLNNEPLLMDYRFVRDIYQVDMTDALQKLQIPAMIIHGSADKAIPYAHSSEAYSHWPEDTDHALLEIPGAGHDFKDADIRQFITATISWLDKYHT